MKSLIAIVVAAFGLAGCVAVPVGGGYGDPYGSGYYYGAPAVSLGYTYHDGGYRHRRYR